MQALLLMKGPQDVHMGKDIDVNANLACMQRSAVSENKERCAVKSMNYTSNAHLQPAKAPIFRVYGLRPQAHNCIPSYCKCRIDRYYVTSASLSWVGLGGKQHAATWSFHIAGCLTKALHTLSKTSITLIDLQHCQLDCSSQQCSTFNAVTC